jgi:hypothetical protein
MQQAASCTSQARRGTCMHQHQPNMQAYSGCVLPVAFSFTPRLPAVISARTTRTGWGLADSWPSRGPAPNTSALAPARKPCSSQTTTTCHQLRKVPTADSIRCLDTRGCQHSSQHTPVESRRGTSCAILQSSPYSHHCAVIIVVACSVLQLACMQHRCSQERRKDAACKWVLLLTGRRCSSSSSQSHMQLLQMTNIPP